MRAQAGGRGHEGRISVTLACSECKARNYKTTKSPDSEGKALELKKFCKQCGRHTLHRETK
jgi:large subunit ribosomal protein L33